MFLTHFKSVTCTLMLLGLAASAYATENVKLTFSKPNNPDPTTVHVLFIPGMLVPGIPVDIPPNTSATEKRDLIRDALIAKGYDVTTEDEDGNELPGNQLRVLYLRNGTKVNFGPGTTGEIKDDVLPTAAVQGDINFVGVFDPFDAFGDPAVFTAGIVTDVGELTVEVSSEELNFQTDGPTICQALFEQLAPQVPPYGVDVLLAGDRLDVYFDPAYIVETGGVSFGTTSLSEGCSGGVLGAGSSCLEDLNDDGVVGLSDLAVLLAAYGTTQENPTYVQRADLDGNGVVDLADLATLLAAYGTECE
jgi:hypothetical protein